MLNVFRGGPLDNGMAYPTEYLCRGGDMSVAQSITEYNWTPELVVGEASGLEARVWRWKEQDGTNQAADRRA